MAASTWVSPWEVTRRPHVAQSHRIVESLMLEKTSRITKSNPNPSLPCSQTMSLKTFRCSTEGYSLEGMMGMGQLLNLVVLEVFSNLSDSTFL